VAVPSKRLENLNGFHEELFRQVTVLRIPVISAVQSRGMPAAHFG
jgi:hypothetical protein